MVIFLSNDPEVTLGGYLKKHERAPAFAGSDGRAYSVEIWVDEVEEGGERFGAALLFIRWSVSGDVPDGHVESDFLAFGASREEALERIKVLSLYDVKAALDEAVGRRPDEW